MDRVTWKTKIQWFALFSVAYAILYVVPNMHPGIVGRFLPLLPFETQIPLMPWTFLIYVSDYFLAFWVICLVNDRSTFHSYVRLAFTTLTLAGVFFWFYPTVYPRPQYPEVTNPLVRWAMAAIAVGDTPKNCFPSMHVAITAVSAWVTRGKSKAVFGLFILWSFAIFVSTLTTKQHYFWDVIGGALVALIAISLDRAWATYALSPSEISRVETSPK